MILSGYNIHAGQNCSQFFMRIQNYMIFFLQANLFENFNILEQNSKRAHDFMSKMLNSRSLITQNLDEAFKRTTNVNFL